MAHSPAQPDALQLELSAVVVAVTADEPRVLVVEDGDALPSGPFESDHRTLELGLRAWVEEQTRLPLGYVEQLYTFADRGRVGAGPDRRVISLSYLALTREARAAMLPGAGWQNWYRFFPWEDWRAGPNALVGEVIRPSLDGWAADPADTESRRQRRQRVAVAFGRDERSWNEELVLQRFELLYEAGLVPEAACARPAAAPPLGQTMTHDHRRILATGIARLRAKIKYRPVVFELMPQSFSLLQLQRAVEALAGRRLHKQNFRRFIENAGLVEETGEMVAGTGGRPAKLVRFRREVLMERAASGTKLPLSRSA